MSLKLRLTCDRKIVSVFVQKRKWSELFVQGEELAAQIFSIIMFGHFKPFLESDNGEMTGNEGERDATNVCGWIPSGDVAAHGQRLNP